MKNVNPELFSNDLLEKVRQRFCNVDSDPFNGNRIYFENAGGSLRLKEVVDVDQTIVSLPDSASRPNKAARWLGDIVERGKEDFRLLIGAKAGEVITSLTASRVMFHITQAILENAPSGNVVTTRLEHPSSYDSAKYYAGKTGREVRVAGMNVRTGSVDMDEILKLVDKNTTLLSVIHASNLTGAVLDIQRITQEARKINPDIFVLVDAVQHVPHAVVDVEELQVDGLVVAPYKMFGRRGLGLGYISDRVAALPHDEVYGKKKDSWMVGSADPSGLRSITCIVDYICWIAEQFSASGSRREQVIAGMERITAQEQALLQRILYGHKSRAGLKSMVGATAHCVPDVPTHRDLILAVTIDGLGASDAVKKYQEKGISVFERLANSNFSQRIMDDLGLPGIVRVSPMHFNTPGEVDHFLAATEEIVNRK